MRVPDRGYDDRSQGHSVGWNVGATEMINDRPAVRAQQEYSKAVIAFEQGKPGGIGYAESEEETREASEGFVPNGKEHHV